MQAANFSFVLRGSKKWEWDSSTGHRGKSSFNLFWFRGRRRTSKFTYKQTVLNSSKNTLPGEMSIHKRKSCVVLGIVEGSTLCLVPLRRNCSFWQIGPWATRKMTRTIKVLSCLIAVPIAMSPVLLFEAQWELVTGTWDVSLLVDSLPLHFYPEQIGPAGTKTTMTMTTATSAEAMSIYTPISPDLFIVKEKSQGWRDITVYCRTL
jgi:hypothetical protein